MQSVDREYSSSTSGGPYLKDIFDVCDARHLHLHPYWVDTKRNVADNLSRGRPVDPAILPLTLADIYTAHALSGSPVGFAAVPFTGSIAEDDFDDLAFIFA